MLSRHGMSIWMLVCSILVAGSARAEDPAGDSRGLTFERDIRPILRAHCLDCHGATDEKEGSLDLRLVRFMLAGGDAGPAIVPGKPAESYLLDRVKDGEMPPGSGKLTDAEIKTLEQWIAAGAPTARPEPESIGPGLPLLPEERAWWAFQPIRRPNVPQFPPTARVRTPIDALLLDAMPEGLTFSPEAAAACPDAAAAAVDPVSAALGARPRAGSGARAAGKPVAGAR